MSRFQASTTENMNKNISYIMSKLSLEESKKAEYLRIVTEMVAWLIRQSEDGRTIIARGSNDEQLLVNEFLSRLREQSKSTSAPKRIVLSQEEAKRMIEILENPEPLKPAMINALENLADPNRTPPEINWG